MSHIGDHASVADEVRLEVSTAQYEQASWLRRLLLRPAATFVSEPGGGECCLHPDRRSRLGIGETPWKAYRANTLRHEAQHASANMACLKHESKYPSRVAWYSGYQSPGGAAHRRAT
eukprot:5828932-Pleurochrysis_carterae.AAC.1